MARRVSKRAWWAVTIEHQDSIEDNARNLVEHEGEQGPVDAGFVTADGEITEEGWKILNDDIMQLERNCVRWLKDKFSGVYDTGHDMSDDLVGALFYNPRSSIQRYLIDLGIRERIDFIDTSYGDLADTVWDKVSRFGASVLGGHITFEKAEE